MAIIVEYLRDPIVCGIIIAAVTVMTILALRTRSVFTPEQQKWRETCWVLLGSLVIYLLINGWGMLTPSRAPLPTARHLKANTPLLSPKASST